MKRALVTGSAGFVGRHMTRALQERGWDVDEWDLADGYDARHIFSGYASGYDSDPFDLVVHAAFHVGGRVGIEGVNINPALNAELDAAMFAWAVKTKQRRVVYFSSSAAYPVKLQSWEWAQMHYGQDLRLKEADINLSDPAMPDVGYGWAKLTGERLATMARACGVPVTVLRPFSGYGEDQSTDYPFPSIMQRAVQRDWSVWGPRGQMRDWIHISDVIAGTLAVVDAEVDIPVNLCTGRGVEMGQLLRMATDALHSHDPLSYPHGDEIKVAYQVDKPTGVFHRVGNPDQLSKFYTPKVTIEEGVSKALRALI